MPVKEVTRISQHMLRKYKQLEEKAAEFDLLKKELAEIVKGSYEVQPGKWNVQQTYRKGQIRPLWKDEWRQLAVGEYGEDWANKEEERIRSECVPGNPSYGVQVFER